MTTQASNIPVAIDYTSRDYYSLREDLISIVKQRVNQTTGTQWSGEDPADFGVALIEAFAYMGDILNYYIDRVANEGYLPTATQRQSIINLAALYGYTPGGYQASTTTLTFQNASDADIDLPAGTQVTGEVVLNDVVNQVIFTTLNDATVPAAVDGISGTVDVEAKHGEQIATRDGNQAENEFDIAGELLAVSDGLANQSYQLYENQVVEGTVSVFVQNGDIYEPWTQVVHLADYGPNDAVYSLSLDADNFVYVNFGDGVSGAIPTVGAGIKAQYDVGGGIVGNIAIGIIKDVISIPGLVGDDFNAALSYLEVTNSEPGFGGADPEDNDSIRVNAPKLLTALNRAVTLKDYANLALAVTNVGKANATATSPTAVTLYIAPKRSVGTAEEFPGFNVANTVVQSTLLDIITDVESFMEDKIQIGVDLKVFPPSYVPVQAQISFIKYPQYTVEQIKSEIKSTILTRFAYEYLSFGQVISPRDIEFEIMQIPGVRLAKVSGLLRSSGEQSGTSSLIAAPDEIFVFQDAGLSLEEISNDPTLSVLSSNVGTLSPTFTPNFTAYNLTGVAVDSIILTLDTTQSLSTILVNGSAVTTGTATVLTPAATTTVATITVTAPDESTVKVYTVTIAR